MAEFLPNTPIDTDVSTIEVTINPNEPLVPGIYTFQLVVEDDDGNVSVPANVQVTINDPGPMAVLSAPAEVPFGDSFELNGEGSNDIAGGEIVVYRWTLVDVPDDGDS